jgi:DNA-directed RNA polymerase specialized sigma24 family protein
MLAKRFPRFDEDERLAIYHDAWARLLGKRERGEEIESLRAYLMATCSAEALHIVSRSKTPTPVAPEEPLFTTLADESAPVDEQVVMKDQARLARDLIDSLDERQRDVLKLRWDLQLRGSEVRAALGLTRRQYQRLTEEGAAAIAKRVEELEDGTWSRRQRSLLMACLVQTTADGEQRRGIASERQRREAQRLLDSDPHFAALYAEVRGALDRAAVLLPLPLLFGGSAADASVAAQAASAASDLRDRLADLAGTAKHHALSLYLRAGDPAVLSGGPRPGAAIAAVLGCVAIGGGAFGTYDALSKQASAPIRKPPVRSDAHPAAPEAVPTAHPIRRVTRLATRRSSSTAETSAPTPQADPTPPAVQSAPAPQPAPSPQPAPNPQPATTDNTEFSFEN